MRVERTCHGRAPHAECRLYWNTKPRPIFGPKVGATWGSAKELKTTYEYYLVLQVEVNLILGAGVYVVYSLLDLIVFIFVFSWQMIVYFTLPRVVMNYKRLIYIAVM
jgi:hypothetical protein